MGRGSLMGIRALILKKLFLIGFELSKLSTSTRPPKFSAMLMAFSVVICSRGRPCTWTQKAAFWKLISSKVSLFS